VHGVASVPQCPPPPFSFFLKRVWGHGFWMKSFSFDFASRGCETLPVPGDCLHEQLELGGLRLGTPFGSGESGIPPRGIPIEHK
jgi:hypothetical protein